MLQDIGAGSIADLFSPIPPPARLRQELSLPPAKSEAEIIDWFAQRGRENGGPYPMFLGAGAYRHYRPVVIDALISRGEFFTAYTPYQPEIAQGTLQAIFEFQTMICELTGMEVANASMYDGSTAATEAVMMAHRISRRAGVVVARSVHPEYRAVLRTYGKNLGWPITEVPFLENGRVDLAAVDQAVTNDTACVLVQSPNFFGTIEDVAAIAGAVHPKGALLVVAIAEAVSLGAVRPPAEADIVALEAQAFGIPLSYGGPYAGVIAAKEKFVRQMPGRLVGEARDPEGRRGFVLTLSAREQHIRREKATSNICTNQALAALMATIFIAVYGKRGLAELARHNLAKTAYAVERFQQAGAAVLFAGAPRFNEFVVRTAADADAINQKLLAQGILGGFTALKKFYPELGRPDEPPGEQHAALWCCTEMVSRAAIETAAAAAGGGDAPAGRPREQKS
jgi:glycine dehydrogenase subunit 1